MAWESQTKHLMLGSAAVFLRKDAGPGSRNWEKRRNRMANQTTTQAALSYWKIVMESANEPQERRDKAAKILLSHGAASARSRARFKSMKTKLDAAKARIKELESALDGRPEPEKALPMVGIN